MFHVSHITKNNVLSVGVKSQTSFVKEDSGVRRLWEVHTLDNHNRIQVATGLPNFFGLLAVVPKGKIKTIPGFLEAAL